MAHFEFLMASPLINGVILSVAVLQAERRISATRLCGTGSLGPLVNRGLFGMALVSFRVQNEPLPNKDIADMLMLCHHVTDKNRTVIGKHRFRM